MRSSTEFDVNGFPLNDSQGRWYINIDETTFDLAVTKDVSRLESTEDGDLPTPRWRTEAPLQSLSLYIRGSSESQINARKNAWRNLFNQEELTIGRTVDGVRVVATARTENQLEVKRTGFSKLILTAYFRIPDVSWSDEDWSLSEISYVEGQTSSNLAELAVATAPMTDVQIMTNATNFTLETLGGKSGVGFTYPQDAMPVGSFIRTFGERGNADPQLEYAINIAVRGDLVYVVQYSHTSPATSDTIKVFNKRTGEFVRKWNVTGSANAIGFDSVGNIYVVEQGGSRVSLYNYSGAFVSSFGSYGTGNGQFENPSDIAFDSAGNIYVTDSANRRIQKFTSAGVYVSKWGSNGSGDGQFGYPSGIAIDDADRIYVTDSPNHRIQVFDTSGTFISKFGTYGSAPGQLKSPLSLAFDSAGLLYVSDYGNNRIVAFEPDGTYVTEFGSFGSGDGQFGASDPGGIAIDSSSGPNERNYLYMIGQDQDRVQVFNVGGVWPQASDDGSNMLLVDVPSLTAWIIEDVQYGYDGPLASDFDRRDGVEIPGASTLRWGGEKLRLEPYPSTTDLLTRELETSMTRQGGTSGLYVRTKRRYL